MNASDGPRRALAIRAPLSCEFHRAMAGFIDLLRHNRNYRYTWLGQVVSETGDAFNNIAVFSLALESTGSGLIVSGVMLARAIPAVLAGPIAGVALDRLDRRRIMIASDLLRAAIALAFILTVSHPAPWLLYLLSGLLMFASPFFTSGRSSILPAITTPEELHTANSVTQTTQWATLVVGTLLAGASVVQFGYAWAFALNSFSFLFSASCIGRLRRDAHEKVAAVRAARLAPDGGFRAERRALTETDVVRPFREYGEGLRYMWGAPLILGIAVINIGWATGGGAAQILFSIFGEIVFHKGAAGIAQIWASAGVGLLIGGAIGHWFGKRFGFHAYKRAITVCYIVHGGAYIVFSQMTSYALALLFIGLSRAAVGVSSVLNMSQLLRHVPDEFRGRVFATMESLVWAVMLVSMGAAGIASESVDPRTIGAWSGALSSTTAIAWGLLNLTGRLPEPKLEGIQPEEIEVHGEPTV
ncbi:MAG: MFS transporter [Bryobacteraceae bacterium]